MKYRSVQSEIFEHKIRHFETKSSYFEHFLSLFKRFNLCFIVFSQNNSSCIEASSSDCESPSFIGMFMFTNSLSTRYSLNVLNDIK